MTEIGEIDKTLDILLGPSKKVQVVAVNNLFGDFFYPVLFDLDFKVTKEVWNGQIIALESIQIKILISLCDQSPDNQGLYSKMNVSIKNVEVVNPFDPSRIVLCSHDIVHIIKLVWVFLLDNKTVKFSDGSQFSIEDFKELMYATGNLCKLKDIHFKAKSSDRQTTSLATQMISENNANLFMDFFPNDVRKVAASKFCRAMKRGFKVLTSTQSNIESNNFLYAPFGKFNDLQTQALMDMNYYFKNIENTGRCV